MKKKFILIALCLAMLTLLFASCKKEGQGSGDNANQNQNQNQSCTHSFAEGVCVHCGESDPNYKPGGSDNTDVNKGDEQNPDEPEVPPIDMGGETELPFVPAK